MQEVPFRVRGGRAPGASGGTAVAADSLISILRRDVLAYLRRKGEPGDDAEDVIQEAFVRFHRAGHDLTARDARPLLFVIARNIRNDRWRAISRRPVEDIQALDDGPRALVSEACAADDQLISRQNLAAAAAVIRGLPPKTRDAFLLHRFEDLTYRQIADRIGVSVSMVEKHVAEALRQLKKSRGD